MISSGRKSTSRRVFQYWSFARIWALFQSSAIGTPKRLSSSNGSQPRSWADPCCPLPIGENGGIRFAFPPYDSRLWFRDIRPPHPQRGFMLIYVAKRLLVAVPSLV